MSNQTLSEQQLIKCEVCLKEVPAADAESIETADYVAHFCGLECYQHWHERHQQDGSEKLPGTEES